MKAESGGVAMQRRGLRGLMVALFIAMACSLLALLCTDFIALLCSPILFIHPSSPAPRTSSPYYSFYNSNDSSRDQRTTQQFPADGNATWGDGNLRSAAESSKGGGKEISSTNGTADAKLKENSRKCNYYAGRWVKQEAPLMYYSGSSCKRWLSSMWACREMKDRPDFDYEQYKWQPDGCDLPIFDAQDFLHRMRNKVVAFVGDSIGRQQYQSMMCMLTGGDDGAEVNDVSKAYGLEKPRGAIRADGTAQRFVNTNTTIIYYWSATLCQLTPLNSSSSSGQERDYALHLDLPVAFLHKYLPSIDLLVLNTGHHWNRGKFSANRWLLYSSLRPLPPSHPLFRDLSLARNSTLHHLSSWLLHQLQLNHTSSRIFFRSLSPRHFAGGDWNSGGRCDDISVPVEHRDLSGRTLSDPDIESALRGKHGGGVRILNVTYISQFRDEAHISKYSPNHSGQDCLHWCLPGVPDVWNELLYAEILQSRSL